MSRDRRGYERITLVHSSSTKRGRQTRPGVLYWYRTPPGIRVGREAFDESTRRALEAQYPDLSFNWSQLTARAAEPPDVEPWRERKRAQRAGKRAHTAEEVHPQPAGDPNAPAAGESAAPMGVSAVTTVPAARNSRRRRRRGGRGRSQPQPGRTEGPPGAPAGTAPPETAGTSTVSDLSPEGGGIRDEK
jgi:hypothetical protein